MNLEQARPGTRTCGDTDVRAGRGPGQLDWYRFALRFAAGKRVLDVGCGLGDGLGILATQAALARGQDLDPRLGRDDVTIGPLADIESKSYDVIICVDVIEHVEDDAGFARELQRIAREGVFLTTPNWTASRCQWPYHLREYTPRQFKQLLAPIGRVTLFKGTPNGDEVYRIRSEVPYYWFNDCRTFAPTAFLTRCCNHLVPRSWRIHSHNAAWVDLTSPS